MNGAKLQLSKEELALVRDPSWILTKNSIIGKVVEMLGELAGAYGRASSFEPRAASQETDGKDMQEPGVMPMGTPKISRGENYKGLPWVVLDYPRLFGKEDIFAIRTLFWWGHYFSLTLHLKGKWKTLYLPVIERGHAELASAGFQVGISEDEWRHEHNDETYRPMSEKLRASSYELRAEGREFFKLGVRHTLEDWEGAPEFLLEKFRVLAHVLQG